MMHREIRKLSQSFRDAFRGIVLCVRDERNFRIHITAAFYVSVFAIAGKLSITHCAILCVCFGLMMGAELMNTAIERVCDKHASGYDHLTRDAKDIAAGGVLVCAIGCVVVAILLFLKSGALFMALGFFVERIWAAALLVLTMPLAVLFVFSIGRRA